MNKPDTWYVQKGVEIVGWKWDENTLTGRKFFELPPTGSEQVWVDANNQVGRDALAAELVRQVDASEYTFSSNVDHGASVGLIKHIEGPDRTMNTIRCIVDSKVLEGE